jgi:uncharacterized protein (DUF1778 family)
MLKTGSAGKRPRSERREARLSEERKQLFLRAAALQGRSLTDFVIASAQQAAIDTVRSHDVLQLSERDRTAKPIGAVEPVYPYRALVWIDARRD